MFSRIFESWQSMIQLSKTIQIHSIYKLQQQIRRNMSQEQIQTSIKKQLKNKDISSLIQEILLKQGLNSKARNLYRPESSFLQTLLLYFILREQSKSSQAASALQIAQMHQQITKQLNSYNLNFKQKQNNSSQSFPEKIVILSLLLPMLANNITKLFCLEPLNSEDCFITLLYLSTGKLVSLKAFSLCRDKMRKKFAAKPVISYPSIRIIKKDFNKTKTSFYKSEIQSFKEELKSILCPQIGCRAPFASQKSFFSKSSKMSNTLSNLMKSTKQKFTQISQNINLGSKARSRTMASHLTQIKKRVSVDCMISKQNSRKRNDNSGGVKFLLKKDSFISVHSQQKSLYLCQSKEQSRYY